MIFSETKRIFMPQLKGMRTIILIALVVSVSALKAQTIMPGSFLDNNYRGISANNIHMNDISSKKNWSLSRYSVLSTSYAFFRGGSAAIISAPVGLQLNRGLNNNLYAFAGVSVAPAYVSLNRSFMANDLNKANQNGSFFQTGNLGLYSRAELGLQYVNDERTFSISGSIGIQRSSYPVFRYDQMDNTRANPVFSNNR